MPRGRKSLPTAPWGRCTPQITPQLNPSLAYMRDQQMERAYGFVNNGLFKNAVNKIQKIGLKENNIVIFVDLKRAFDSVQHQILENNVDRME